MRQSLQSIEEEENERERRERKRVHASSFTFLPPSFWQLFKKEDCFDSRVAGGGEALPNAVPLL